ncbi:hypothetical protein BU16DRAFT_592845 [Lophium mytilinum]|uniref:Uncharacterized protein n=1 Tax=Lophium mytilinum TaxID=390894 RepID=A0A6A6QKV6_9PEZI|nr:hypothetical protein BU16DRAFT_592845 [Lophium mytilinum]
MRLYLDTIPAGEWLPSAREWPEGTSYPRSGDVRRVWCLYMGFVPAAQTKDDEDRVKEMKSDEDCEENEENDNNEKHEEDDECEESEADEESQYLQWEEELHYALVLGRDLKQADKFSRLGIMYMNKKEHCDNFQHAVDTTIATV